MDLNKMIPVWGDDNLEMSELNTSLTGRRWQVRPGTTIKPQGSRQCRPDLWVPSTEVWLGGAAARKVALRAETEEEEWDDHD